MFSWADYPVRPEDQKMEKTLRIRFYSFAYRSLAWSNLSVVKPVDLLYQGLWPPLRGSRCSISAAENWARQHNFYWGLLWSCVPHPWSDTDPGEALAPQKLLELPSGLLWFLCPRTKSIDSLLWSAFGSRWGFSTSRRSESWWKQRYSHIRQVLWRRDGWASCLRQSLC